MTPTPPDPASVPSSKPIIGFLFAGIVGGVFGALGGATLNATPPATNGQPDIMIAQVEFRRPGLAAPFAREWAYGVTVKHLLDGGTRMRDEGSFPCGPPSDAGFALINELDTACAPGAFQWLHVAELRFNPVDGGTRVTAYRSHLIADGGRVDDGQVPCDLNDPQGVANVVWIEAVGCIESALDQP